MSFNVNVNEMPQFNISKWAVLKKKSITINNQSMIKGFCGSSDVNI